MKFRLPIPSEKSEQLPLNPNNNAYFSTFDLLQITKKTYGFMIKTNTFTQNAIIMRRKEINGNRVVIVGRNLSNKWLAEQLVKNEGTISSWCTNDVQPSLHTLVEIAELLKVSAVELLNDK